MWESVLKKDQWEIQVDQDHKSILLNVSTNAAGSGHVSLQLDQSELFELLHTFLSINRSFNNETMYYDDLAADHS
ncbi:hypothetical protein N0M98_06230 [Paenibacillus doosanensis]|uniref:Uncharacterized protein n=1 Tax=Paenibacillus konkukensis TaxID=2020716 RepID=A0ABY4RJ39_9BACL|nr:MULTISPECIES: hypothetical protein [Paenibacillus]MCS7459734.1 hypothetical protein [Paenibacillus doosanensis]UQZ81850.1 hypothetical protein SK3146_01006 [Paenibacillus konkukensis]